MQRWQSWVVPLGALWLAACGGSNDDPPPTPAKVPELASAANASGNWRVSVAQGTGVEVGRYLAGDGGQRMLLLTDADSKMTSVLVRKDARANWELGAGAEPVGQVQFASTGDDSVVAGAQLSVTDAQTVHGYALRGAKGQALYFTVDAEGLMQPSAGTDCRWQGEIGRSDLPQTLTIRVEDTAGCWGGGRTWSGLLVRDAQDAPAAFRAISTDGSSPAVDAWVFAR